jgi:predicted SAM-dependent methyltransferase
MLGTIRRRAGFWLRIRRSKLFIRKILKEKHDIYLEIGSGPKKGKDKWITLDIFDGCDIIWDLFKGIPFPDNSVSRIYNSHLLEHFYIKDIKNILNECLRVLVPDGEINIAVPNARIYIDHYINKEPLDEQLYLSYKPAYNFNSYMDYVNYIAYMDDEHRYMFDEENLLAILKNTGFKNARLREFDSTLDMESRRHESIYVIAKK